MIDHENENNDFSMFEKLTILTSLVRGLMSTLARSATSSMASNINLR